MAERNPAGTSTAGRVLLAMIAAVLLATSPAMATLEFSLTATGNSSADAGFTEAGARWSTLFIDDITVNINTGFASLGSGILASSSSVKNFYSYTDVRGALVGDVTSASDTTATSNLQSAPALTLYINRTKNSPYGTGSATPYVDSDGDANNTTLWVTNANAKALGLIPGSQSGSDATITFNSDYTWDFDPANGITAGSYDFVGIATHEIGHALGFVSGVDILDQNSPNGTTYYNDNIFTYVSTLDLYRYSDASVALDALDWTADTRQKFFSIDGGDTEGALFATGKLHGDGRQASHWKDNLDLGILDPTAANGELLYITDNDILALDVIGYDLAVPEPATLTLMALGMMAGFRTLRRRRA